MKWYYFEYKIGFIILTVRNSKKDKGFYLHFQNNKLLEVY